MRANGKKIKRERRKRSAEIQERTSTCIEYDFMLLFTALTVTSSIHAGNARHSASGNGVNVPLVVASELGVFFRE
jgi:hypothetical protein